MFVCSKTKRIDSLDNAGKCFVEIRKTKGKQTTSKLKCPVCPYCGKPLHCGAELNVDGHNVEMWYCTNYACEQSEYLIGTREMWELVANRIQAKQDLETISAKYAQFQKSAEIATKALEMIKETFGIEDRLMTFAGQALNMKVIAEKALEQIQSLDQKENQ